MVKFCKTSKILYKLLTALILIIITMAIFVIDVNNVFTEKHLFIVKNAKIENLNFLFWIIYFMYIFLILLFFIFIKDNRKQHKEFINEINNDIIVRKEENYKEILVLLYVNNKINEATLWIRDTIKYDDKIKFKIKSDISIINNFFNKRNLFLIFLFDLNKFYSLYEDIEMLLMFSSNEEKQYFKDIKNLKKELSKNLVIPKYIVTRNMKIKGYDVSILKLLNEITSQVQYESLVMEVRTLYYKDLIEVVKSVNNRKLMKGENEGNR